MTTTPTPHGPKVSPTGLTTDAALQQATGYHMEGRLQDAERLYLTILQKDPHNPDANHNLGVLAMQMHNNPALGLRYFKAALEADPLHSQYRASYARALNAAGQPSIEIVSATRLSEKQFQEETALGISLQRLSQDPRLIAHIAFANTRGLPEVFNARINAQEGPEILAFIHDDVWIDDYFFADRVVDGLKMFDVIGVAGNRRRVQNQSSWAFVDNKFTWDNPINLSGSVAHGKHPFGRIGFFGPVPAECELMDGVFLAAKKSMLRDKQILFDPRFDFHFYDLDFCRSARKKGLRLGTWPVCITHQSGGAFRSTGWAEKYRLYLEKWGE